MASEGWSQSSYVVGKEALPYLFYYVTQNRPPAYLATNKKIGKNRRLRVLQYEAGTEKSREESLLEVILHLSCQKDVVSCFLYAVPYRIAAYCLKPNVLAICWTQPGHCVMKPKKTPQIVVCTNANCKWSLIQKWWNLFIYLFWLIKITSNGVWKSMSGPSFEP